MVLQLIKKLYFQLNRSQKRLILFFLDILVLFLGLFLAFFLRLELFLAINDFILHWRLALFLVFVQVFCLYLFRIYNFILYYSLNIVITKICQALSCALPVVFVSAIFYRVFFSINFPRLIIVFDYLVALFLLCGFRFFIFSLVNLAKQVSNNKKKQSNTIIFGAGEMGGKLLQVISNQENVVAFIDDHQNLKGQNLAGIKIYTPSEFKKLNSKYKIDNLIIAVPSINKTRLMSLFDDLKPYSVSIKIVSSLYSSLEPQNLKIRNLSIEDLIGREEVFPMQELLEKGVQNKVIAITGAGGSIGRSICKTILAYNPKFIILIDNDEESLYLVENLLKDKNFKNYQTYLCNILSSKRLDDIFSNHSIDLLYHAAAYKHVNIVEQNPVEGVLVNVFGTMRVLQKFVEYKGKKFVLISTDKAINPTSIMGKSKRLAELVVLFLAKESAQDLEKQNFTIVRFGNVVYSSGSVIPRFEKLIKEKKTIQVTHKDAVRYFMSLEEAATLVIQSSSLSKTNDIVHLDMGNAVKIYDLACNLIRLYGYLPEKDIAIKIGGLKKGEKIVEENLIDSKTMEKTQHPKIYKVKEEHLPGAILDEQLAKLLYFVNDNNKKNVLERTIKRRDNFNRNRVGF